MIVNTHSFNALDREILVHVATPREYTPNTNVMIFSDAQNFFALSEDPSTNINLLETTQKLIDCGLIQPCIIVGINCNEDSFGRFTELSPWESDEAFDYLDDKKRIIGGKGGEYSDFIINTILPFTSNTYNIVLNRDTTSIGGFSMSTMIAIYTAIKHPNHFSKVFALSPALWCFEKPFKKFISKSEIIEPMKVYMSIGRKETSNENYKDFNQVYVEGADFVFDNLKHKVSDISYRIDIEGEHNGTSVNKLLTDMLLYMWKK